jgi:hypothetical protein
MDVGLETVFNNLDAARVFHSTLNVTSGRYLEEPKRLIDALRLVLPALLGETIAGPCEFHAALARRLRATDAVISLNYDCVIDMALREHAGFRFDLIAAVTEFQSRRAPRSGDGPAAAAGPRDRSYS